MDEQVAALLLEGLKCERSDPTRALCLAQEALALSTKRTDRIGRARALRNLAYGHHGLGQLSEANTRLQQAHALAESLGDESTLALCCHTQGFFLQHQGQLQDALTAYRNAAHLRERLGEQALLAGTLNNIGTACSHLGDNETSLRSHQQALQLWRATQNQFGEAITLTNIGKIYTLFGNFDSAQSQFEEALETVRPLEALPLQCETQLALAGNYRLAGQPQRAQEALAQAQQLAEALPDSHYLALVLVERAWQQAEHGHWAPTRQALGKALRLFRQRHNHLEIAHSLYSLGTLALAQGALPQACRALNRCLGQATRYGLKSLERDTHERLSAAWERRGVLSSALAHYQSFHCLDRLLITEASERQRLQILQEIELEKIRQHNTELSRAKQLLEEANARLKEQASRDGMTGLLNHHTFQEKLHQVLSQAQTPTALLLLDVDHFKHYNDDFGHPEGDEVLKQLAQLLRGAVRQNDLLARYGGEEFVVLLPATSAATARRVAERIRRAVATHSFPQRAVTASVGIAVTTGRDANAACLLRQADQALYAAKHAGRNCCKSFQSLAP